jgi:hypothetical protein
MQPAFPELGSPSVWAVSKYLRRRHGDGAEPQRPRFRCLVPTGRARLMPDQMPLERAIVTLAIAAAVVTRSPNRIHVSEVRLTRPDWTTPRGLHVGDPASKLRRLYPNARLHRRPRLAYWLATTHGPCIGGCTPREQQVGVDYPRLTAQVRGGRVIALWLPVFGQGE